jgi:protein-disulfide isomerase/uncharacterized membrane protein
LKKPSFYLVILVAVCGAALSTLLILQHYNQAHELGLVSMMCGDNTAGGCAAVNRSSYSEFLGIPLAAYGLTFYLSIGLLAGLSMLGDEQLRKPALQIGFVLVCGAVLVDLILFAIQAFGLDAFCNLCLSTYVCTALLFLLMFRSGRRVSKATVGVVFQSAAGKMLFAGWLIGSVAIAFGSAAGSMMIAYQDPTKLEERFSAAAVSEFQEAPLTTIDVSGAPSKGPKDAPIQVVIYSDFLCPWCRQVAQSFQQHFNKWQGKVVIYYKNYPMDQLCNRHNAVDAHRGACFAALGGLCAQQQGKFWEYHDRAFERPPRDGRDRGVINIAQDIGLDTVAFKSCLASTPMQRTIQRQIEEAYAIGVNMTPRVYINGKRVPKINYLPAVLANEAKRLGLPPLEGLNE